MPGTDAYRRAVRQAILHSEQSEWKHIAFCILFCVPICTTVCLIVDRVLGG